MLTGHKNQWSRFVRSDVKTRLERASYLAAKGFAKVQTISVVNADIWARARALEERARENRIGESVVFGDVFNGILNDEQRHHTEENVTATADALQQEHEQDGPHRHFEVNVIIMNSDGGEPLQFPANVLHPHTQGYRGIDHKGPHSDRKSIAQFKKGHERLNDEIEVISSEMSEVSGVQRNKRKRSISAFGREIRSFFTRRRQ